MTNYQSIPRRFNRPTSSINHQYIDATLREKQNVIDTNYGIMQQTVDAVLGQDLIREKDKEYLKQKVSGVLNTLSQTDAIKFDSKKARFTIQDALDEAVKDPEILKQVANTKKFRQIQEFQKQRQKKGNLNQQNFLYAYNKSGANEYLNGTSDELGSFNYLEYVDVDARMDDMARKLKAANPNEQVSIQDPVTGKTVSKKVSMITPAEMRGYLRTQLNDNDLKQLEINGAMMYGMNDKLAVQDRDYVIEQEKKGYQENIQKLENWKNSGRKTPGQIAEIDRQIEFWKINQSKFERSMIGQTTAEIIGANQLMEDKLDLYSKLYTKNGPESIKYDSAALKRMRDVNSRANLSQTGNPNISTITTPTNLPENIDPYKDSMSRVDTILRDNSQYLRNQFNSLNEDDKKLVEDTINQIKNDPDFIEVYKGQSISNETLQLEALNRLGANFFSPDVAKELRSRIAQNQSIQKGIDDTTSEFVKVQLQKDENTFDQLFKEETNLTMVTPDGDVNIQKFLRDNGVRDYESYKSFIANDSKEAKQLRATLALQSMSLTNDLSSDDVFFMPGITPTPVFTSGIGSTNKIDLSESEYRIMRQSAHDISGESLDETFAISKKDGSYTLVMKDPNTKLAGVINRTNELYQSGRVQSISDAIIEGVGFDIDKTVRNESSLRNLFQSDEYTDFARENLRFIDKTVAGSNSIRIKGDNKKNVGPLYEEILQHTGHAAFDKRLPIDIYKTDNGELIVTQTVKERTVNKKGEVAQEAEYIRATVQANDVKKMNLFNNQISMLQKKNTLQTLEDINEPVTNMNFIRENRSQIEGLNRLYNRENKGENLFRLMSSENDARKLIFNSSVDPYISQDPRGMEIKSQFEDFVTNTHNYSLDFSKGVDSDYQVSIKNKEGSTVGTIPLNKNVPVEVFEKAFYGTPQAFLSLYTKYQVDKYMKSIINRR